MHSGLRRHVVAFYAVALGVSWLLWAPWVLSVQGVLSRPASPYWHLLGSLGPAAAALLLGWRRVGGRASAGTLLRQTINARAVLVAALWGLLVPTLVFVALALGLGAASHQGPRWSGLAQVAEYPALGRTAYVFASLLFYGFGEELGWRGLLYPALRTTRRPLAASLLVVPFWALWHLPLFFATESYRGMGVGGMAGWLVSLVSGSLLTAWLYDSAGGSVLPAAVLHATLDVFFLADLGVPTQSALGAVVTLAGLAVVADRVRAQRAANRADTGGPPKTGPGEGQHPAASASEHRPHATFAR
jgi:membrane protease YdiL (CAAX protease family)